MQSFYPELSAFLGLFGDRINLHSNIIQLGFGPGGSSKFFQGFYKPELKTVFTTELEKKGEKFSQYFFGILMEQFFAPESLQKTYQKGSSIPLSQDKVIVQILKNLKIIAPSLDSVTVTPSSMYFNTYYKSIKSEIKSMKSGTNQPIDLGASENTVGLETTPFLIDGIVMLKIKSLLIAQNQTLDFNQASGNS